MSDLISRQAAKNKKVYSEERHEYVVPVAELDWLPSAQSERPKGKWISRDGKDDCFECSECHAVIEGNEVYWRNNYFCYHCGADMRGEQDG